MTPQHYIMGAAIIAATYTVCMNAQRSERYQLMSPLKKGMQGRLAHSVAVKDNSNIAVFLSGEGDQGSHTVIFHPWVVCNAYMQPRHA